MRRAPPRTGPSHAASTDAVGVVVAKASVQAPLVHALRRLRKLGGPYVMLWAVGIKWEILSAWSPIFEHFWHFDTVSVRNVCKCMSNEWSGTGSRILLNVVGGHVGRILGRY
eukprot:COSAG02_NODE_5018_length_4721_cov_6.541108_3_plen_112_part_00